MAPPVFNPVPYPPPSSSLTPPGATPSATPGATPGGAPAGYGRSCTNCSRAKCKCILRTADGPCERCYRLGKDCRPIETSRKRIVKKVNSSRTAQLEEKLDDLVSILRASQHPGSQSGTSPPESSDPAQRYPAITSRLDSLATAATATSNPGSSYSNCTFESPINPNLDINDGNVLPEPTDAEAEVYLDKFRGWMKNFPFAVISPGLSASDLRRGRPFLWLCIMNTASMSMPQMIMLKDRIRAEVAQKLVIEQEPSMDLLLGLIVHIAWATLNTGPGVKPFLILITQMATGCLYDLGLARSPIEDQYFTTCFRAWGVRPQMNKMRTLEERRALLSLWFLTSYSNLMGKIDTLRWTPHMEESLEVLEREKAYPLDEVLTTFIRIQLVGDEANKLMVRDVMGSGGEVGQTPSYVFRKGMMTRLQNIRDNMSPAVSQNLCLQAHSYSVEISIQSLGLFMPNIPNTQRIDTMYACLRAVRAWYDIFFTIPPTEIPGLPFSIFVQLPQTQVALYRLTTAEDPSWDKEVLRTTADLLTILDNTATRFDETARVYQMQTLGDGLTLFHKGAKIVRNVKANWEPALAQTLGGGGIPTPASQGRGEVVMSGGTEVVAEGPGGPGLTDPELENFNIEWAWMSDAFGPWEL